MKALDPRRVLHLAVVIAVTALSPAAFASGMLIPEGQNLPPLAIKSHRVETTIRDQAATTKVVQVFQNNVNQTLEATYLFPLPKDASIRDFSMIINGQRVQGELLERDKARGIYESIVRRLKDPGLLEYADANLIRARVYPIAPRAEQQIELTYSEQLVFDGGVVRYLYPLKTGGGSLRTMQDLVFQVSVDTKSPLKSVYSPTHKLDVARKGDLHATASYEEKGGSLNDDFLLYYTVATSDIGLNVLTFDPGKEDGYFMMMLAPKVEMPAGRILAKDVTFVVDTSGSMSADNKMRQAQNALKLALKDLNDGDRFNIIRFSTEAEPFKEGLVEAKDPYLKEALAFVDGFRARGGTNIDEGLRLALKTPGDPKRPHVIVFMTDGIPTIGETDIGRLIDQTRKGRGPETRVFVFGVGYDVNTKLLDTLSTENRGVTRYVRPEEDIEVAMGSLWTRISEPVLGKPQIKVDSVKVYDLYPKELPDLFASDQVIVYGRYAGRGGSAIRLTGDVAGERREMVFETTFTDEAKADERSDFIPALWATRKVGYLLEEIRLKGENPELKDEVVRLSKEFGIMTPYTSFLVLPENELEGRRMIGADDRQQRPTDMDKMRDDAAPSRRGTLGEEKQKADAEPYNRLPGAPAPMASPMAEAPKPSARSEAASKALGGGMAQESGEAAVKASEAVADYKEGKKDLSGTGVRRIGAKTFQLRDGVWTESTYDGKGTTLNLKYESDAYFRIIAIEPDLAKYLALGSRVVVQHKGVWIVVGDRGRDQITDDEVRTLFSR
ncbi:MAG: VIT and VWA domain-containing protein [Acidobacteriota bacterium]